MAAEGATYLFNDVHFSGVSSQDLCSAGNQKHAEYLAAWNNFQSNVVTLYQNELWQLYQQVNHAQNIKNEEMTKQFIAVVHEDMCISKIKKNIIVAREKTKK